MEQFMVEFTIPNPITLEFTAKIPMQRIVIHELMSAGKVASYTFSMEAAKLWVILNVDTKAEAREVIDKFPLLEYMPYIISEIVFNNVTAAIVPTFSLN